MGSAPTVLLLDDGELDGVRRALDRLGVGFEHVVRYHGKGGVIRPRHLLVTSARCAHEVEHLERLPDTGEPVWVCMHNQDFLPMRERLRALGVHYLVSTSLEHEAMRLFFLQILHRGSERRRNARLQLSEEVRFQVGDVYGKGRLEEISRQGCRLAVREEVAEGAPALVHLPAGLASGRKMTLTGSVADVVRNGRGASGTESRLIVVFRDLEPEVQAHVEAILTGENLGTRVTPLRPPPEPAASEDAADTADDEPEAPADEPLLESVGPGDRRGDARRRYRHKLTMLDPDAPDVLLARDLSTTGVRVGRHARLAVGSRVSIALYGRDRSDPLVLEAAVLREDPEGFGLQFTELTDADRAWLERVCDQLPGLESLEVESGVGRGIVVSKLVRED